jgi:hypothetical protein
MTRHHEPFDLRMANDRSASRTKRLAEYRRRTKPVRDRVQVRWWLGSLVRTGAVER